MAPKPKPATVGMVLAMALTILAAMTWAVAQPSLSLIYRPELPLLYDAVEKVVDDLTKPFR